MNILMLASKNESAVMMRNLLEEQGYHVQCASVLRPELASRSIPDLILAELTRDDYGLLLQLRDLRWDVPIMILSDELQAADRIFCIERGAVYFLSRHFEPGELLAYLAGIKSRRKGGSHTLRYGNTTLDAESCQLTCRGKHVRLSSREFHVMHILLQSKARIVAKQELLSRVWGSDSDAVENHVEVYIGFLRKKLQSIDSDLRICTARRLGYHLEINRT